MTIKLDRERELRYGFKALLAIEKRLGKKLTQLDENNCGMEELAVYFWAGLIHEDKTLTLERAIDLLDAGDFREIAATVNEAMGADYGTQGGQETTSSEGNG